MHDLENLCKDCGGSCCCAGGEFLLMSEPESFIRFRSGFFNDDGFRKSLIENIIKKFGKEYQYLKKTIATEAFDVICYELSSNEEKVSSKEFADLRCAYYLDGCLIHKYKPDVCANYQCKEYKKIKKENDTSVAA